MDETANKLILSPAVRTARSPEPPMLQQQRPENPGLQADNGK